jgi:hypothetical protein
LETVSSIGHFAVKGHCELLLAAALVALLVAAGKDMRIAATDAARADLVIRLTLELISFPSPG